MTVAEAFLDAFVVREKRQRLQDLYHRKRRDSWRQALSRGLPLDRRFVVPILPAQQVAGTIFELLRDAGAPETAQLISEWNELDGLDLPLKTALERSIGYGMVTVVSCIPGRLAFYEGEGPGDRLILRRDALG